MVGGVKTPAFKQTISHIVHTVEDWRIDPDMVFDVLRHAADEWHKVEMADKARATLKKRPTANANEKSGNGGKPGKVGKTSTPAPDKTP